MLDLWPLWRRQIFLSISCITILHLYNQISDLQTSEPNDVVVRTLKTSQTEVQNPTPSLNISSFSLISCTNPFEISHLSIPHVCEYYVCLTSKFQILYPPKASESQYIYPLNNKRLWCTLYLEPQYSVHSFPTEPSGRSVTLPICGGGLMRFCIPFDVMKVSGGFVHDHVGFLVII